MSDCMWRYLRFSLYASLLLCVLIVASCGAGQVARLEGERVDMRHSSLLEIIACDGYTVVDIKNPWGKGVLDRYILVPSDSAVPLGLPEGTVVRTPLKDVVLFSGVHAMLFEELGVLPAVAGVCDSRYLYSKGVKRGLEDGTIHDCGSSLNVNSEVVARINPDAIFVLPYENGGYGKLDRFSYPLVKCADYMESSPLGCAEWVRFYGRLLGCAERSDSIFDVVCSEYEALCSKVAAVERRPRLMCELKSSSAWYVPGGKSTMGQMYKDAGADYLFAGHDVTGSVPLSVEVVLETASDADIWLLKYNSTIDKTCQDLLGEYDGYAHFKPFREKSIYACNTHRKNIFEEAAFHPEKLLKELVALFHPYMFQEYKTVYYEKMR